MYVSFSLNVVGRCGGNVFRFSRPKTSPSIVISFSSGLTFLPACHFYLFPESRGLPFVVQMWPFFFYRIECFAFVFSAFPSALRFLRAVSTSTPLVFTKCRGSHVFVLVIAPHLSFRFVLILHASFFNFFHLKLPVDIYSSSSFPSPFSIDADPLTGTKT